MFTSRLFNKSPARKRSKSRDREQNYQDQQQQMMQQRHQERVRRMSVERDYNSPLPPPHYIKQQHQQATQHEQSHRRYHKDMVELNNNQLDYPNYNAKNMVVTGEDVQNSSSSKSLKGRNQLATASQQTQELFRTAHSRDGLNTVHTQRIVRKTTTLTQEERANLEDDELLREKLIRWAQRSTDGYPYCNVKDLSTSWRDGFVFNAILHRNRPELLDYRLCKERTTYENLDNVFELYDRECGIRRILEPEQVDNYKQDERAMFHYIYSIYQRFPNPPERNPLLDDEKLMKIDEYKDRASRLLIWIRENLTRLQQRNFPNTIEQMKVLQSENNRFRAEDVPLKLKEKQYLMHFYREISRYAAELNVYLDHELTYDNIDIMWSRLLQAHQEREQAIIDEIARLEKLERFAENVRKEIHKTELKLDDIERQINEEEKKVRTLDPFDTKFNLDGIEKEIRLAGEKIAQLFEDVAYLRDENYHSWQPLQRAVEQLEERLNYLNTQFQERVVKVLEERRKRPLTEEELIAKYEEFRFLDECIRWVRQRIAKLDAFEFDNELSLVERQLDDHKVENRTIINYQSNVDKCNKQRTKFKGEELAIYTNMLERLHKLYGSLCTISARLMNDLEALVDFLQKVVEQLTWISQKEEIEAIRDWSVRHSNLEQSDQDIKDLIGEMGRREISLNQVINRGENLIRHKHQAKPIIQDCINVLQYRWSWLQNIVKCSQTHLKHSSHADAFYSDCNKLNEKFADIEHQLNTTYSQTNFSIEKGEELLKGMQVLKAEINEYSRMVNELINRAKDVVPMRLRRPPLERQIKVKALFTIKQENLSILSDESCTLKDNSNKIKWALTTSSAKSVELPGVCFTIPPPDQEAIDLAQDLKRKYEDLIKLWTLKNHKLRCALIMATINILKDWDYDTYINMDPVQRNAIIKALDDDVDKVVREGPPNDPDSKRLQDEMRALKKKFADFDERFKNEQNDRANLEKIRKFTDACDNLLEELLAKEQLLKQRCENPIPRSPDALSRLIAEHREFEFTILKKLETRVEQARRMYNELPKKNQEATEKLDQVNQTWSRLNKLTGLYSDRLRDLTPALNNFEECSKHLKNIENKLNLRDDKSDSKRIAAQLRDLQTEMAYSKSLFDQLLPNCTKVRSSVSKTRSGQSLNEDVDQFENDCRALIDKWNSIKDQLKNLQSKIETFNLAYDRVDNELSNLCKDDALIKPISSDKEIVKQQKNEFKLFLRNKVEPLGQKMEEIMNQGEDLINLTGQTNYSKIESTGREIRRKLDQLNDKWNDLQNLIKDRLEKLNNALDLASRFWDEHSALTQKLKEIKQNVVNQEPPALEPSAIEKQKQELEELKIELQDTKPRIDDLHDTGNQLQKVCAERERPEIRKNLEELDSLYDNVKGLIQKRERLLNDALGKAGQFHQLLQEILDFLEMAEAKLATFNEIPLEIDLIKNQLKELKEFKRDCESYLVEIEKLNKLGKELMENAPKSAQNAIKEPLAEVNRRYQALMDGINNKEKQLENALLRLGQFQTALKEFQDWLNKTENQLEQFKGEFVDLNVIELEISKHKNLMNEIKSHQSNFDTLNKAGQLLVDSKTTEFEDVRSTRDQLDELNNRWKALNENAKQKQEILDNLHKEISKYHYDLINMINWITDLDAEISVKRQVGGLPETAREQLNKFLVLYEELMDGKMKAETLIGNLNDKLLKSREELTIVFRSNLKTLKAKLENALSKASEAKLELEKALKNALEFDGLLRAFLEFLDDSEKYLNNLPLVSKLIKNLEAQIEEHQKFQLKIDGKNEDFQELDQKGTQLKYFCQKQDVVVIKNQLISAQNRWEKVKSRSLERGRQLEASLQEVLEFNKAYDDLMDWITEHEQQLDSTPVSSNADAEQIRQQLLKHKEFQRKIAAKQITYENVMKMGKNLLAKAPRNEQPVIQDMLDELKRRWNGLFNKSNDRQRKLEEDLLLKGQFKDAIKSLLDWLDQAFKQLSLDNLYGDLDTVNKLADQHNSFLEEMHIKGRSLNAIKKTARELLENASIENASQINVQISKLDSDWEELTRQCERKSAILEDALIQAEKLHKLVHSLLEWLSDAELKLRFQGPIPEDEQSIRRMIKEHEKFIKELGKQEVNKNTTINFAEEILTKAHPEAISVINHWITIIQARYDEVQSWSKQWAEKLNDLLSSYENVLELIEQLLNWLVGAENSLNNGEANSLPDDIGLVEQLVKQHQVLIDEMQSKQGDFERIVKIFSNQSIASRRATSTSKYTKRWRTSTPNLTSELNISVSDIRNVKVRELVEKWKIVQQMCIDRLKRLNEKLEYLNDMERTKNFSFEEWRKRFSSWVKNQHGKLLDFYRKIDYSGSGRLSYDEFIEGFLNSKFPTCKAEMEKVAPVFDRNFDTYIDQKEFLDTLRSEVKIKTEDDIINDEVQRQVSECNCLNKFKVYQVGEGKYRFGESQTLRLVRILRSTIMVRVGGGWQSLEEFLQKNDPCRMRGRTNLNLKDHLAEGASQGMAGFLSRSSQKLNETRASNERLSAYPSDGPITKIREKTERSLPIGRTLIETTYTEDTVISSRPKKSSISFATSGRRGLSRESSEISDDSIDEYINKFDK